MFLLPTSPCTGCPALHWPPTPLQDQGVPEMYTVSLQLKLLLIWTHQAMGFTNLIKKQNKNKNPLIGTFRSGNQGIINWFSQELGNSRSRGVCWAPTCFYFLSALGLHSCTHRKWTICPGFSAHWPILSLGISHFNLPIWHFAKGETRMVKNRILLWRINI